MGNVKKPNRSKYICIEGTEGVGKTTQTKLLVDFLNARGLRVLQTKEPGIDLIPLTMKLRGIMLDNQFDAEMTIPAREFISQAIRSIHLEKLIIPSLYEYDFIIQDRGILSGYAYGEACGNSFANLYLMATQNIDSADAGKDILPIQPEHIYDQVIYLKGNPLNGLLKARFSKQEFTTGDAMESRGNDFIEKVSKIMDNLSYRFNTVRIDVDNRSIKDVHNEIIANLGLDDFEK
jgi:dTMP kinase